jgi:hypothetical protein
MNIYNVCMFAIVYGFPAVTQTCPTSLNNICTATRWSISYYGTTCCKELGYVFSKDGCVVRDAYLNPKLC